jgi:hypothetical protein
MKDHDAPMCANVSLHSTLRPFDTARQWMQTSHGHAALALAAEVEDKAAAEKCLSGHSTIRR